MISASSDVGGESVTQESDEENRSLLVSSVANDAGTLADEQSVAMTTSHETDNTTLMDAVTPMLLDAHEEEEGDPQK